MSTTIWTPEKPAAPGGGPNAPETAAKGQSRPRQPLEPQGAAQTGAVPATRPQTGIAPATRPQSGGPAPRSYGEAVARWGGKPYYSLNQYLQQTFHEKVYKLAVDGGFSCPNRDGTLGNRGCIFCSAGGSGDFAARRELPFSEQIEAGKSLLRNKNTGIRYIAYFQAYTNTYAPLEQLRQIYTEAIAHPEVAALSIATRPDCLDEPVVRFLSGLSKIKPVFVELGLQTIHEATARYIRRGYSLHCFEEALDLLKAYHLEVVVHTILGLPGESPDDMIATARYLAGKNISGLKPQLLHVLKGTDLAEDYKKGLFHSLTLEEYTELLISCIEVTHPQTVIHRITGDGPKNLLIAPLWSGHKKYVMNYIHSEFKRRQTWQGKKGGSDSHDRLTDNL